jgi:hypothetical protein
MSERAIAQKVLDTLKLSVQKPAKEALVDLNALIPLVQSAAGSDDLEVEEARSSAFMRICEVGKALHRGQSTETLYTAALEASERWVMVAR